MISNNKAMDNIIYAFGFTLSSMERIKFPKDLREKLKETERQTIKWVEAQVDGCWEEVYEAVVGENGAQRYTHDELIERIHTMYDAEQKLNEIISGGE